MSGHSASQDRSSQQYPNMSRDKFTSPPPPADRMTPPPSSQIAGLEAVPRPPPVRTPTPTRSHLSSPPPTLRRTRLFDEDTALASRDELIELAAQKDDELRKANATIAAQRMQMHYLREDLEHQAVEMQMQARDTQLLHHQLDAKTEEQRVVAHDSHLQSELEQMNYLRTRLDDLAWEYEQLRRRCDELEAAKEKVDDRCDSLTDHCYLLRGRLEDKSDMIRMLRSQLQAATGVPRSQLTPSTVRIPQTPSRARGGRDAFDQLLLADKMLQSQTSPSTPTPTRQQKKGLAHGHRRASHSLSSLQSSPVHTRTMPHQPGAQKYGSVGLVAHAAHLPEAPRRRRLSRDSTISASDADDDDRAAQTLPPVQQTQDSDVLESRASQEATSLLRRSASGSFRATGNNTGVFSSTKPMKQGKLFGQITKPGAFEAADAQHPSKKRRLDEGVGLGIGGWGSPRG